MIVGLIGYDSIRKHLAACGYYTAEIREKYYLRIADAYIDIKEQRGQYWLENIMKDRFAVSMFGQKRLSREGGIEIVVKELCTRMARDGCQVTCYNRSGHHVSGAEYDNKIEYDGIRQKFVPTIERKGLAAVSSSFFAALYSAFGKYDVVHIHAEGPAFFSWLPKMTTENMEFTETTISDFSSACTEVTTEYTETTTECVEETTTVDEPSTESTETTTEEVTEPSTEEYTEQITEQPTTEPKPTVPPKSVKFNKNTITLGVGESYTLITTIENGDISQVEFTTDNSGVITVDDKGKMTAVGIGVSTITAKTYNGLTAKCKVTVKKLANSIKLDKTSIILGVGEQYDFSSYVPSGTAAYYRSYYSDDPNIAFVQKAGGLMTAKKAGTTTMRCKMPNGTQATCNVTVKPLATSLKLNASEIVLYIGQSFDINSSVPKGTAAYYRLYSSSNSKIAAVTRGGGVVKGVATGKATVTCTLNNGKKAICNVYIMPQSKKISNVPLIGQSKLPTGCETCSATMLLNFYGYKISETTFADKYLVKKPFGYSNGSYTGPDPNCAFVGTPYSSNSYGAYAPIMVKCMNKYLSDKSYKAVEISGKSLEYLSGKYVAQGQPIMVWATINMSPSFKTTTWRVNYTDENAKYKLGSYYTWTAGEHCLLLTGYDKDYYYFNDPWTNARTRYSKSLVNTRYNELGKQAVVMVKK